MISFKLVVVLILVSYCLFLFFIVKNGEDEAIPHQKVLSAVTRSIDDSSGNNTTNSHIKISNISDSDDFNPAEKSYEFSNSTLALDILTQLDVYKPLTNEILKSLDYKPVRSGTYMGFRKDDKYCLKHREFFAKYPESIFDEKNLYLAKSRADELYDLVVPGYFHAEHLDRHKGLSKAAQHAEDVDFKHFIDIFYTSDPLYKYFHVGKQFSCLTQISNHIPGSATFCSKSRVIGASKEYLKKYENRPQCLNNKLFPNSWWIYEKEDCEAFFKLINDPAHKQLKKERNIVYIKKIPGLHEGQGVELLTAKAEEKLRDKYDNGKKCGKLRKLYVMQDYIYNPLLLNKKKFDFRIFMLVASVNPLMVYYHDGYLSVSLVSYNATSDDKKALMPNLALKKDIDSDEKRKKLFGKMTAEEVRLEQRWSFERLQEYLLDKHIVGDSNWLNNYLRPELKKALIHLTRIGLNQYFADSSLYELFGVDFMLDDSLKLWFLEANDKPIFSSFSAPMKKFIMTMLRDQFEVVFGLLKSRAKRIVDLVNGIMAERNITFPKGKAEFPDLKTYIAQFNNISKNYFEKEFELKFDNGFVKIVDENYKGVDIYQGLFPEGCL